LVKSFVACFVVMLFETGATCRLMRVENDEYFWLVAKKKYVYVF